jgi:hypothetical protein
MPILTINLNTNYFSTIINDNKNIVFEIYLCII